MIDPFENKTVPILKRLIGTQSHHSYFVEFEVKCNVCYTLRTQIYLQKMYAAISDDYEDNQVNFL